MTTSSVTYNFKIETGGPHIAIPDWWYVWESASFRVSDGYSNIASVRMTISDPQNRWPKVGQAWTPGGTSFTKLISWDRRLADGTLVPIGTYRVTIHTRDAAGNESKKTAKIIIPAANATAIPRAEDALILPAPPAAPGSVENPASVFTSAASVAAPAVSAPAQTAPEESVQTAPPASVPFTFGSNPAPQADDHGSSNIPSTSSGNILWGAAAAAAVGAFIATVAEKKRREEEERKEAEMKRAAWQNSSYGAQVRARQLGRLEAQEVSEQQRIADAADAKEQKRITARLALGEKALAFKEKLLVLKVLPQKKKSSCVVPDMSWKRDDIRAAENYPKNKKENPRWWEMAVESVTQKIKTSWEATKVLGNDKVIQPFAASWEATKVLVNDKVVQPFAASWEATKVLVNDKVVQPVITSPVFKPLSIGLVIGATLIVPMYGATTLEKNILNNPNLITVANQNTVTQVLDFYTQYPVFANHSADESLLEYFAQNPYEAIGASSTLAKNLTLTVAGYLDAVWQEHPIVRLSPPLLKNIGEFICSQVSSLDWRNRCYGASYLSASLLDQPFDTVAGIVDSFIFNPLAGIGKMAVFYNQHLIGQVMLNTLTIAQIGGREAVKDYGLYLMADVWKHLVADPQVQSGLLLLLLTALAIASPPAAAGVVTGMTVKGLIDLDAAVTTSKDKKSLIDLVTSHEVRTTVVSSLLILTLITAGLGNKVSEFRAFQEKLSPSSQLSFNELSLIKQTRIADLAVNMNLPSGAVEFYLKETGRYGSSLESLSLSEGLKFSSLIDVYGEGILKKVLRASEINNINPLKIIQSFEKGQNAWTNSGNQIPGAIEAEARIVEDAIAIENTRILIESETNLIEVGKEIKTSLAQNTSLALEDILDPKTFQAVDQIARNQIFGEGNRTVLGKWSQRDAGYIGAARYEGGLYFETNPQVYDMLVDKFGPAGASDVAWVINQRVLERTAYEFNPAYLNRGMEVEVLNSELGRVESVWENPLEGPTNARFDEIRWLRAQGFHMEPIFDGFGIKNGYRFLPPEVIP